MLLLLTTLGRRTGTDSEDKETGKAQGTEEARCLGQIFEVPRMNESAPVGVQTAAAVE